MGLTPGGMEASEWKGGEGSRDRRRDKLQANHTNTEVERNRRVGISPAVEEGF